MKQYFFLNSEVNTHNVIRYARYGQGHPKDRYIGNRKGADQVLVWIGLTGNGEVFGPHFARGNLDTREYLRIVRYNVIHQDFAWQIINRFVTWWKQDGANAHTSNASINYLRGRFHGRLISKRADIPWPPRSPDLAVSDFFLWGYIKQKTSEVTRNQQPSSRQHLRAAITRECRNIPRNAI